MNVPQQTLVWVHGDSLTPADPAIRAHPGAVRVFVFDEPLLRELRPSFKRLFFLDECARDVTDEIRLGDPVTELLEACQQHGATRLAVTRSLSPRFAEIVEGLQDRVGVDLHEPEELVSVPHDYVPRRFSAFWRTYGGEWSGSADAAAGVSAPRPPTPSR